MNQRGAWDQDRLIDTVLDGRYRIDARIGAGAMGAVYRAHQLSTGRDVAIKVLLPGMASDDIAQRFQNEAHTIARLRSPHTLKLIDSGRMGTGQLFIVTEYLVGTPLNELLAREALAIERSLEFAMQVCSSLEEAHAAGVVHRDLKPANLFVEAIGAQEHLKVLDFGIAKIQEQPSLTATGLLLGTPNYMSPEQAEGRPIDFKSDLYSLGIVLFRCVTGRLPFSAPSPVVLLRMHIDDPAPPLESGIAALDDLFARLVAKTPAERPDNAAAVRRDLARIERELHARRTAEVRTTAPSHVVSEPDPDRSSEAPNVSAEASLPLGQTFSGTSTTLAPPAQGSGRRLAVAGAAMFVMGALIWAVASGHLPTSHDATSDDHVQDVIIESTTASTNLEPADVVVPPTPDAAPPAAAAPRGTVGEPKPADDMAPPVAAPPTEAPPARAPPPARAVVPPLSPKSWRKKKAEPGTLTINVRTSSGRTIPTEIRLGDQSLGTHSVLKKELPPGIYTIEIRPEGYPVQRRRVTVRAGETTVVRSTAD